MYNYGIKRKLKEKSDDDDAGGKLDVMKTQATVLQYYCMNSRNDYRTMRLKAIEEEYYSIEN